MSLCRGRYIYRCSTRVSGKTRCGARACWAAAEERRMMFQMALCPTSTFPCAQAVESPCSMMPIRFQPHSTPHTASLAFIRTQPTLDHVCMLRSKVHDPVRQLRQQQTFWHSKRRLSLSLQSMASTRQLCVQTSHSLHATIRCMLMVLWCGAGGGAPFSGAPAKRSALGAPALLGNHLRCHYGLPRAVLSCRYVVIAPAAHMARFLCITEALLATHFTSKPLLLHFQYSNMLGGLLSITSLPHVSALVYCNCEM